MPSGRVFEQRTTLTKRKREIFLKALETNGSIAAACRVIDVTSRTIEKTRKNNRYFDAQVSEAIVRAVGRLEEEAWKRAVEGDESFVVSQGRVVRYQGKPLIERKKSDRLMEMLLRANGGDKYKNKSEVEANVHVKPQDAKARLLDKLAPSLAEIVGDGGDGGDDE
jgi:hypothetical protein